MRIRLITFAVVWLMSATLALAQTQITTGVIQGTVMDATGAVLPGVASRSRTSTPISR